MTLRHRGIADQCIAEYLADMMEDFKKAGMDTAVSVIGKVADKSDKLIRLY